MLYELGFNNKWHCYDIDNTKINSFPDYEIKKNDSINSFPQVSKVAITNPPYLAKNSATRDNIDYPDSKYDDLYKISLDVMLLNCDYVAAIIPESFITQNIFHDRLYGIISLKCKMFDDTECPVCLALFIPNNQKSKLSLTTNDFLIYKGSAKWGNYSEAKKNKIDFESNGWKFNSPTGKIGLYAIDNTTTSSIKFVNGDEISSDKVKVSSRGITRIDYIDIDKFDIEILLKEANNILNDFRSNTNDLFLTSFRGLRKDGSYRRRLDFKQAKSILSLAVNKLEAQNA